MYFRVKTILFCILISLLHSKDVLCEWSVKGQGHEGVAMRMIGHQLLLSIGDSTSRVMPVVSQDNRFKISFENEFGFAPDSLINIVKRVVADTEVANSYIVEVHECDTTIIVHSFEFRTGNSGYLPCIARSLPKDCYDIYFTILDPKIEKSNLGEECLVTRSHQLFLGQYTGLVIGLLLLSLLFYFVYRKRKKTLPDHIIEIGKFHFDKINMKLVFKEQNLELSNKETDLLSLLYEKANQTVNREDILKSVWGDDGNYVGRTLDVFISKLRKKLELDPSIQILNIRGIGYKMVVEDLIH